jgi:hypothetical protein
MAFHAALQAWLAGKSRIRADFEQDPPLPYCDRLGRPHVNPLSEIPR